MLIYLGLGSNIKPEQNIKQAVKVLRENFKDIKISNVYQSKAVGFIGADFYNLVVGFESDISLTDLLPFIKNIEKASGRIHQDNKYSDRTLDIDVLLYGNKIMRQQGYDIPRKEINKFAFVLKPLAEIGGELIHPELNTSIKQLWNDFNGEKELKKIKINLMYNS